VPIETRFAAVLAFDWNMLSGFYTRQSSLTSVSNGGL